MEKESFENEEIAQILNENFVSIKVDREERPDVDRTYMLFIQFTTGSGGWPMNVFLTPQREPFYGGTYFPPVDSFNSPGFPSVLNGIASSWKANSTKMSDAGRTLVETLRRATRRNTSANSALAKSLSADNLTFNFNSSYEKAFETFQSKFDADNGGFTTAPKFPTPVIMHFLLTFGQLKKLSGSMSSLEDLEKNEDQAQQGVIRAKFTAEKAHQMAFLTLLKIAHGGIHDHIGKGFHRYSVDSKWHIPHFEKMLYDQAQLLSLYSDAITVSPNEDTKDEFTKVVKDIAHYVRVNLTSEQHGLYCAEDADSFASSTSTVKKEGAFYVWTYKEIEEILPPTDFNLEAFCYFYGIKREGNVDKSKDPHGELLNQNVLTKRHSYERVAEKFKMSVADVVEMIEKANGKLYERRLSRPRPHLDNKIISGWNGLYITGLCKAYRATGNVEYRNSAIQTASFVCKAMLKENVLYRSYCDGLSDIEGFADDYSYFIQALLELFEVTHDGIYFTIAVKLQEKMDELFWDSEYSGYFNSSPSNKDIVLSLKEDQDGSEPSTNSVAANNLWKLWGLTSNEDYKVRYNDLLSSVFVTLKNQPHALPFLCHVNMQSDIQLKKIIVWIENDEQIKEAELSDILQLAYGKYGLMVVVLSSSVANVFKDVTLIKNILQKHSGGKGFWVYYCENQRCQLPVNSLSEVKDLLNKE
jgi:uncharacterized protein YyaL (SSP411 family)